MFDFVCTIGRETATELTFPVHDKGLLTSVRVNTKDSIGYSNITVLTTR